ncbi:hypothetical protein BDN72DRAFT_898854 [Pluteus cervinus]|uniref:Uncharacterized protein n=1 Tax=Pluteus cervinus TaxID=181527 RepID=A0ACD3APF1_9AGAR|nr:hypothetical protein BDN72DRAFT_898854 [Pluteus cervinus]
MSITVLCYILDLDYRLPPFDLSGDKTTIILERSSRLSLDVASLLDLWSTPVLEPPKLHFLREYFEHPLEENWKVPLSRSRWQELLHSGVDRPEDRCKNENLNLLFKQSEDEKVDAIWHQLCYSITGRVLDPNGTEDLFHDFWDINIKRFLLLCLPAQFVRNSD